MSAKVVSLSKQWLAAGGLGGMVHWWAFSLVPMTGNEAMRAVNERLGYVMRTISRTVERPL